MGIYYIPTVNAFEMPDVGQFYERSTTYTIGKLIIRQGAGCTKTALGSAVSKAFKQKLTTSPDGQVPSTYALTPNGPAAKPV